MLQSSSHPFTKSLYLIQIKMIDWESENESLAQNFAGKAQRASSYMLSSRASRRLREEGEDANEQIELFKQEIQKRYLLSVANKYYSFPYSELSFDNPFEDQQIMDLVGKSTYCLYQASSPSLIDDSINQSKRRLNDKNKSQSTTALLNQIKADKQKFSQILELITNRKNVKTQEKKQKSRQKKLAFKYGIIAQQDEQLLRKRLYTQPYQKHAGFIVKKK